MEISLTDKTMEFNFADDIISRKESRALNKPFITENGSFAVFVKGPHQELVKVEFNKSQASSDINDLGPKYFPKYWATKFAQAALEESEPQKMSLNDISNFYLSLTKPIKEDAWDGKFIFDRNEIFDTLPEVRNALPSYTLTIPGKDGQKEWFPDSEPNKLAYDALKKQEVKYSKNKS